MNQIVEFIKECGVFYVLTMNNDFPAGRPFGAIMEYEGDLYITTSDTKAVYQQILNNNHIQMIALKSGTRQWLRVSGLAQECQDVYIKQKILEECPAVRKHHHSINEPHFNVFQVKVLHSEFL